ncbi:hypothetical protein GQ600_8721 [Phytophthora cactorum]|nr:hypothetical protein GQ600_8721 [Phytophthora cactorum]
MLSAKLLLSAISLGLAVTTPMSPRQDSGSEFTRNPRPRAYCALLDTGVYGCSAGSPEDTQYVDDGTCAGNEQTIGVVGWDHDGCIDSDNVCVAQVSDGDCPSGAYCSLLDTGVYGCVASARSTTTTTRRRTRRRPAPVDNKALVSLAGARTDVSLRVTSVLPKRTVTVRLELTASGLIRVCTDARMVLRSRPMEGCSSNEQTIGVVGWDYDGCIDSDNVCVAQVSNGDCPSGSYCSLLDTGVYGCVASSKKLL